MADRELDEVVDRLRTNVASPNFVYAVGYSLEKTHSGVLRHLLNHHPARHRLAADLWNRLADDGNGDQISWRDIEELSARREQKVGHYAVDLLVEFRNSRAQQVCNIICEYKVDGTGDHDAHESQCSGIRRAWEGAREYAGRPARFALVVTGGSRFWDRPRAFEFLDIDDLQSLLHKSASSWQLVAEYLAALDDEKARGRVACKLANVSWEVRQELGYRSYDWWYAYYDCLRRQIGPSPDWWWIYATRHNPVLCWKPAWEDRLGDLSNVSRLGRLYCEFNEWRLILKIEWNEGRATPENAQRLYQAVDETVQEHGGWLCERTRRYRQPKGSSSLVRQTFNGGLSVEEIARTTEAFLRDSFEPICRGVKARLDQE